MSQADIRIAPSLLAADLTRLGEEIAQIQGHADLLHLDVMDGHFVPNISFGMPVISATSRITDLPLDCHLMTTNPVEYFAEFRESGADSVTVHIEVLPDPSGAVARAAEVGLDFGIALNPKTPFQAIEPFVEECSMVLVMSVEPGFGGQQFIDDVLPKVEKVRSWIDAHGLDTDLQIDGGIDPSTVARSVDAGANVLVAGSAIFRQSDPVKAIAQIRDAVR